ncbi:hypothetical protein D7S86_22030 [Pararobbsia silviterrae]|uniref:Uncharacterized protein n=1 Tax=Pararobbsia silviterrae TaxID=1792498 RepID=A0A494XDG3_9BURK|nr:hypothetical protein D7S86_22030 [Pararobbsia silviterrae]
MAGSDEQDTSALSLSRRASCGIGSTEPRRRSGIRPQHGGRTMVAILGDGDRRNLHESSVNGRAPGATQSEA